jgi:DNA-binding LacI/PurR family transcriptional regulator
VTIAFVAEQAGVSVPTVSKVINGRSDVSASTRQRVTDALREHGYQRRGRSLGRPRLIELVIHELESPWALEIIRGVEQTARGTGLGVVISQLQGRHTPGSNWLEKVLDRCPSGIISVHSELSECQRRLLADRGIPCVTVDPAGEPVHLTPSIGATNWSGGFAATRHLADLGHRRIAMIGGPEQIPCARARLDGYRAAMDAAGAPVGDLVRTGTDLSVGTGLALGLDLLTLPDRPTAIFTANDLLALGVYDAARAVGIRIPQELSVVGFDDLPVARWVGPKLTTVRQPLVEMATAATRLLLSLLRGEEPPLSRIELATDLVVRESTATPPDHPRPGTPPQDGGRS